MYKLRQREMALIPIPFSDLKSKKKRPVIVISNNLYYSLLITQDDMETGNLPEVSMVRADKIYSLSQLIVVKRLGKIKRASFEKIIEVLNRLVASAG
jgi:mRNA interferase MazF